MTNPADLCSRRVGPSWSRIDAMFIFALIFSACATAPRPAAEVPPAYPGPYALLGIEQVAGPPDHNDDSVQLVATYRPGTARTDEDKPVTLTFRVMRSRVNELRDHLETHPAVLCKPEGTQSQRPHLCVAPFEGQPLEPAASE